MSREQKAVEDALKVLNEESKKLHETPFGTPEWEAQALATKAAWDNFQIAAKADHEKNLTLKNKTMSEFKPNQPKSIPTKKLVAFYVPVVMAVIMLIWLVATRDDFPSPLGFWICASILIAVIVGAPILVNRMQRDYRNGRNR